MPFDYTKKKRERKRKEKKFFNHVDDDINGWNSTGTVKLFERSHLLLLFLSLHKHGMLI